jgi:hypothetical protein
MSSKRDKAVAEWAAWIAPRVTPDLFIPGDKYPDLSELFGLAGEQFAGQPDMTGGDGS